MATRGRITLSFYEFRENLIPPYCMMTGERTDEKIAYRFYCLPRWAYLYLTVPIGLIPFIATMMTTFKTKRLLLPATSDMWTFLFGRRFIFLFLLFSHFITSIWMVGFFNRMTSNSDWWVLAMVGFASVMTHLVNVIVLLNHKLHVVQTENDAITFGGVHSTFIDMVRASRYIRSRESTESRARSEAE